MQNEIKCADCGGMMTEGFVVDKLGGGNTWQTWVEGAPEESWLGVKTTGRETFDVKAYRCGGCGRLEFYASEKVQL